MSPILWLHIINEDGSETERGININTIREIVAYGEKTSIRFMLSEQKSSVFVKESISQIKEKISMNFGH